jgi:hypothetical protein
VVPDGEARGTQHRVARADEDRDVRAAGEAEQPGRDARALGRVAGDGRDRDEIERVAAREEQSEGDGVVDVAPDVRVEEDRARAGRSPAPRPVAIGSLAQSWASSRDVPSSRFR